MVLSLNSLSKLIYKTHDPTLQYVNFFSSLSLSLCLSVCLSLSPSVSISLSLCLPCLVEIALRKSFLQITSGAKSSCHTHAFTQFTITMPPTAYPSSAMHSRPGECANDTRCFCERDNGPRPRPKQAHVCHTQHPPTCAS